ncbi:MAG: heterodisulfide reductase-related iron-sulfur binding cluster [Acidobacteriota bacterium]|nr:heterodisulfide reductase-related iron-sulfur binding cluster [Acidobacteriota bacterium]
MQRLGEDEGHGAQGLLPPHTIARAEPPAAGSSFDGRRAPEAALLADCVHCGFCLPACPTYALWGEEMDSPRGRIYMMERASRGAAPLDQQFRIHMDNCLGCMACMTACPSGVQYSKLIEDTRGQVERNIPRPVGDSLLRRMLFASFPHPRRLKLLALPLLVYQRSGLQWLVRRLGVPRLLPGRLRAMEELLPRVPARFGRRVSGAPAKGTPRLRVGMLTGCVQSVFFPHVNEATVRVLAAEGCEVVVPAAQGCCGALLVHSGLDGEAAAMARRTIASFERAEVDTVVINAAGCGSTMKEYEHLLRDDPEWAPRARAFAAKCKDVAELLAELEPVAPRHPLAMRVAYHDACHLRHAQGVFRQPRELLAAIPGVEVAEVAESSMCCGSAGVYNLLHPEPAGELGDRKTGHLLAAEAEAVVSANPGCLLQLMSGLRRRGEATMPALHLVELLDASIRGVSREEVLGVERGTPPTPRT